MMKNVIEKLEKLYGAGTEYTIIDRNSDVITSYSCALIKGKIFGDDECWDRNDFYQYFVSDKGLMKLYYDVDGSTDIEEQNIQYEFPDRIEKLDLCDYMI